MEGNVKAPDYTGNLTKYNPQTNKYETVGIVNLWKQHPDRTTPESKRQPNLSGKAYFGKVYNGTVENPTDILNIAYWES